MEVPVPAMILQPLVENYFKHCFEEGWHETGLIIRGRVDREQMVIEVENDGPGPSVDELEELRSKIYNSEYEGRSSHDHIGLKNIHERLVLNYGSDAGLEVYSAGARSFEVCLVIPQETKEEEEIENLARG